MCVQYSCCVSSDMECDTFDNPADFFLDKLNEAENDLKPPDPESEQVMGNSFSAGQYTENTVYRGIFIKPFQRY